MRKYEDDAMVDGAFSSILGRRWCEGEMGNGRSYVHV